jgi:hypothetical protein
VAFAGTSAPSPAASAVTAKMARSVAARMFVLRPEMMSARTVSATSHAAPTERRPTPCIDSAFRCARAFSAGTIPFPSPAARAIFRAAS